MICPWKGNTAKKYEYYFKNLYAYALGELQALSKWLSNCLKMYYMFYTGYVDTDVYATIYQDETDQLLEDLVGCNTAAEAIQNAIEKQIKKVKDCANVSLSDPGIADSIEAITNEIKDMYDRVDNAENAIEALMTGFDEECAAVGALIDVGLSSTVSETDWSLQINKAAFDDALAQVKDCYESNEEKNDANKGHFSLAEKFEGISDAERRRRESEAGRILLNLFFRMRNIQVSMATGGLSNLVVSGGDGFVEGALDDALKQYGENENGEIDWGKAVNGGLNNAAEEVKDGLVSMAVEKSFSKVQEVAGLTYNGDYEVLQDIVNDKIPELAAEAAGELGEMAESLNKTEEKNDGKDADTISSVSQEDVEGTIITVLEDTGNGHKFKKRTKRSDSSYTNQDKPNMSGTGYTTRETYQPKRPLSFENGDGPVSMENIKKYEMENQKMDSCYEKPVFGQDANFSVTEAGATPR